MIRFTMYWTSWLNRTCILNQTQPENPDDMVTTTANQVNIEMDILS